MRRTVTIVLIMFAGFFICAYPEEVIYLFSAIVNGIADGANAVATSIGTFLRAMFS
jgi:phosphate/sulfate permease